MPAVTEIPGIPTGHETITPSASTGITAGLILPTSGNYQFNAVAALITVENYAINFTLDGTAPTAAAGTNVGHVLYVGDSFLIRGAVAVNNFRCIDRVAGSASSVKITVFHAHESPTVSSGR